MLIALAVTLEGGWHRVVGVAVGLDDQALMGPVEVDGEPFDLGVGDGLREPVVVGELKEQDLQHASEVGSIGARQRVEESP